MLKFRGNKWAVLVILSLGFLMTLVDLTIVNVALPQMSEKLHASLDEIAWVVNAYVILLASLLLTAGRLGDLIGRRAVFVAGVAVFTAASIMCGVSQGAGELIAARAVQGLGAALLVPQTMAIIIATFPPHGRGTAMGIWGMVAGVATVIGPTAGGALVTTAGWRWIFFVNAPVGVAVLVGALLVIPAGGSGGRNPLDLTGSLLASVGLVSLTFGVVEGQRYQWGKIWFFVSIPLVIGAGVVLLGIFAGIQARRQEGSPLVPFELFGDRNYALMGGANVIVSIGILGAMLPLTLYLQEALGFSPLKAGLTMLPSPSAAMIVSPLAGRAADRYGKHLLVAGFVAYAAGMAWVTAAAGPASSWQDFLPGLLISGIGTGCVMSPMQTIASRGVSPSLAGAAAGVLSTLRQFGSVLGSAVAIAVLQNRLSASPRGAAGFVSALRITMAIPAGTMLLGACLALAVTKPQPAPVEPAEPVSAVGPR